MDEDVERFYRKWRDRSFEALDQLFKLQQQIMETKDESEKAKLAWTSRSLFIDILGPLNTIADSFKSVFPEEENGMLITVWREMIATQLEHHIPLSRNSIKELSKALLALNDGETLSVVLPEKTGKRTKAWTISKYKMLAIIHSYVLRGRGYKARDARRIVAAAYGHSAPGGDETVRTWESRDLKKAYPDNWIKNWVLSAKDLGSRGLRFESPQDIDEEAIHALLDAGYVAGHWQYHSAMSLRRYTLDEAGQNYQQALRGVEVEVPGFLG